MRVSLCIVLVSHAEPFIVLRYQPFYVYWQLPITTESIVNCKAVICQRKLWAHVLVVCYTDARKEPSKRAKCLEYSGLSIIFSSIVCLLPISLYF